MLDINEMLARCFHQINQSLFDGKLKNVTFLVNLNRQETLYFSKDSIIEIGRNFASTTRSEILDELVHCAVHLSNFLAGISDHSINQYHNHHFSQLAIKIGMYVSKYKNRGWCKTSSVLISGPAKSILVPCEGALKNLQSILNSVNLDLNLLEKFQVEIHSRIESKSQKDYQIKYICGCPAPYNSIRSGRHPTGKNPLNVTCNICSMKFFPAVKKK